MVTSHLYDGRKSLPLDIELYQHADSLAEGKDDPEFAKKTELAIKLIDRTLERGYRPGVVIVDAGYGNNVSFLLELENRKLKYLGALAKNRKVTISQTENNQETIRLDQLAQSLPQQAFTEIQLNLDKLKTVWVTAKEVELSRLDGKRTIAIVMNATSFSQATDIDYFITNTDPSVVTPKWIVNTYSQRNWVEVFYREAKGWLGLKEYQVREKTSLLRHFTLVFCAYTFILWHQLTGGLRRRWANKPLNTSVDALEAFRTAMSFLFFDWLTVHRDLFATYKASLGFIWA